MPAPFDGEAKPIDQIISETGLPVSQVLSTPSVLENASPDPPAQRDDCYATVRLRRLALPGFFVFASLSFQG